MPPYPSLYAFGGLVEKVILTTFDWKLESVHPPYGFVDDEMVGGFDMVWVC